MHATDFSQLIKHARHSAQTIARQYQAGEIRLLSEICEARDMQNLLRLVENFTQISDDETLNGNHLDAPLDIVLVGIGGSILSPGLFAPFAKKTMRIHKLIRPDPVAMARLFEQLDPKRIRFIVISKSGETAETLALFLCILDWLEQQRIAARAAVIAICATGQSTLRRIARAHDIRTIDSDPDINSRFSLFTALGMFPALVMGLDAEKLRRAARLCIMNFFDALETDEATDEATDKTHDVLTSVAFNVWGGQQGKNIHAMIATDPRLAPFSAWWQQIFSESLGKNDKAITPIWAQLPDDLHVRFQLYLDGPEDKIFTCLTGLKKNPTIPIHTRGEKNLYWLEDKHLSALTLGQEKVALKSLMRNGRPTRIIELPQIDEIVYGDLLMRFVLEILVLAQCWQVSPFGQPAIEQGKLDLVEFMTEKQK